MEFLIANYEYHDSIILAIGRCSQGPIQVGDVFTVTYDYAEPEDPADYSCELQKGPWSLVSLEVLQIEAYRHHFSSLDEGLTAAIQLRNLQEGEPSLRSVIAS